MAVLGLRFCARAFSSCGKRGPLFIAVCRPLTIAVSLVAEHRLQTHRLSSCGSRAQLLRSMWDLPGPGHEPMSPALAGGFLTTAPPGKPKTLFFKSSFRVTAKLRGRCRDFPYTPCLHTCITFLIINIRLQNGAFVTTGEPTLTQCNHSKFRVYITVYSPWWCTFCGYGQMYDTHVPITMVFSLP